MTLAPQHQTMLASWPCLPSTDYRALPSIVAIYTVLRHGGDVLYVGRSRNLVQRWRSHHRAADLIAADTWIAWLSTLPDIDDHTFALLERRCIRSFQPRYNDMPMEHKPAVDRRPFVEQQRYLAALLNQEIAAYNAVRAQLATVEQAITDTEDTAIHWLRQQRHALAALLTQRQTQQAAVAARLAVLRKEAA